MFVLKTKATNNCIRTPLEKLPKLSSMRVSNTDDSYSFNIKKLYLYL